MALEGRIFSGCAGCRMTRRSFLGACAAAGAGAFSLDASSAEPAEQAGKAKVRLVFTHVPSTGPVWPNIGYDFDGRKKELGEKLAKALPEIEFLPVTAMNGDEAKRILEGDKEVDGYLVYTVGIWSGAPQVIAAAGRPTLIVDDLYGGSGEFLIAYASARRAGQKVAGVSSSRFRDVVDAARCFGMLRRGATADDFVVACSEKRKKGTPRAGVMACKADSVKAIDVAECIQKLRGKRLLAVGGGWGMPESGKAVESATGIQVIPIEFAELHSAYERADADEARRWADAWSKAAEKVLEPSAEDLRDCGAMYVAMLEILKKHEAQGITINCLGGFYGGHLKAYPCLGFTEMNDHGVVGGCEGDIKSAVTMLTIGTLTGRPGFISDPVIDTSQDQIIYAHCVAPTMVFGPEGMKNPYHLRSHSEDRKGAVVRSLMPQGYMTTTLEIDCASKQILLHQGKAVDNIDDDKACRSKLAVEVQGDMDKLLTYWDQWGWHRVTYYGDLKGQVQELAKALGMTVIEEA
jgi:hypothetical protein